MFDFHVHTHHSFDGFHSMDELTERAISLGLRQICFTDHKDYDYDGEGNDFTFSYEDFFHELQETAHRYRSNIQVKAGVEFGLQPHILERYREELKKFPFDFVIGSLHSVKQNDVFTGSYFAERSQLEAYTDYFEDMLHVIQQEAPFSVIGHMDMIKRYGDFKQPLPLKDYQEYAESIFRELIRREKGIEVNTSGFRYQLGDAHPSRDLLKLYHQLGGEIIVLGSDSHKITEVGFSLQDMLKVLESIGFKYITTFNQLHPSFHRIQSLL